MKRNLLFRAVALFVLTSFVMTNHFPLPSAHAANLVPAPTIDVSKIQVPEKFGKIEEVYDGTRDQGLGTSKKINKSLVILIQDAHSIPDAQRNIQNLIGHFQKQYGVEIIGVEGAASRLDSRIFQSFPDKNRLKQVFEEYMERGELTGVNAAAVLGTFVGAPLVGARGDRAGASPAPTVFQGIENWDLYEQGIALYLAAMKKEPEILENVKREALSVKREKEKTYSKELLEIDQALENFHAGKGDLAVVLKQLSSVGAPLAGARRDRAGTSPAPTPVIASLLEEINNDRGYWGKDEQKREQKYSQLSSQFGKEFESYAKAVKERLFRNETERNLDRKSHRLNLLTKLAKLELSREEWQEIKASVGAPLAGAQSQGQAQGLPLPLFSNHFAFYENAEKRDAAFFENLIKLMRLSSPHAFRRGSPTKTFGDDEVQSALLVSGGFHTQGLAKRLREKNISYLIVMPKIKTIPENSPYRNQMRGNVSWANYFEVENGTINLYKAFVRATRDRLLRESGLGVRGSGHEPLIPNPDSRLLKQWRDQIIRDLAEKDKIETAHEYTRFLDEIQNPKSRNPVSESRPSWLKEAQKFIDGLRQLQTRGELSEQNILKLLKPSAVPPTVLNVLAPGDNANANLTKGRNDASLVDRALGKSRFIQNRNSRRIVKPPKRSRSEVRSKTLKGIEPFMPIGRFLEAFGIDAQTAKPAPFPLKGGNKLYQDFGFVPAAQTVDVLESAASIFFSPRTSRNFKRESRPYFEAVQNKDTASLERLYLLTYQSLPAAMVWDLRKNNDPHVRVLFYPILHPKQRLLFMRHPSENSKIPLSFQKQKGFSEEIKIFKGVSFREGVFDPFEDPDVNVELIQSFEVKSRDGLGTDGLLFPGGFWPWDSSTEALLAAVRKLGSEFSSQNGVEIGSGSGRVTTEIAERVAHLDAYDLTLFKKANTQAWVDLFPDLREKVTVYRAHSVKELPPAALYVWNVPNLSDKALRLASDEIMDWTRSRDLNINIHPEDFEKVMKEIHDHAPHATLLLRIGKNPGYLEILRAAGWNQGLENSFYQGGDETVYRVTSGLSVRAEMRMGKKVSGIEYTARNWEDFEKQLNDIRVKYNRIAEVRFPDFSLKPPEGKEFHDLGTYLRTYFLRQKSESIQILKMFHWLESNFPLTLIVKRNDEGQWVVTVQEKEPPAPLLSKEAAVVTTVSEKKSPSFFERYDKWISYVFILGAIGTVGLVLLLFFSKPRPGIQRQPAKEIKAPRSEMRQASRMPAVPETLVSGRSEARVEIEGTDFSWRDIPFSASPLSLYHSMNRGVLSPDGSHLLVYGPDTGAMAMVDLKTGKRVTSMLLDQGKQLVSNSKPVFSPGGTLVSARVGRQIHTWSAAGKLLYRADAAPEAVKGNIFDFSESGDQIFVLKQNRVAMLDSQTGDLIKEVKFDGASPLNPLYFIRSSPDGQRLAMKGDDDKIPFRILDAKSLETKKTFSGPSLQPLADMRFSPDSRLLGLRDKNDYFTLLNLETGKNAFEELGYTWTLIPGAKDFAFSPDNTTLAVSDSIKFFLMDLKTGKALNFIARNPVHRVLFSPGGEWLVSAGEDGFIRLWEVRQWNQKEKVKERILVQPTGKDPDSYHSSDFLALDKDNNLVWVSSRKRFARIFKLPQLPYQGFSHVFGGGELELAKVKTERGVSRPRLPIGFRIQQDRVIAQDPFPGNNLWTGRIDPGLAGQDEIPVAWIPSPARPFPKMILPPSSDPDQFTSFSSKWKVELLMERETGIPGIGVERHVDFTGEIRITNAESEKSAIFKLKDLKKNPKIFHTWIRMTDSGEIFILQARWDKPDQRWFGQGKVEEVGGNLQMEGSWKPVKGSTRLAGLALLNGRPYTLDQGPEKDVLRALTKGTGSKRSEARSSKEGKSWEKRVDRAGWYVFPYKDTRYQVDPKGNFYDKDGHPLPPELEQEIREDFELQDVFEEMGSSRGSEEAVLVAPPAILDEEALAGVRSVTGHEERPSKNLWQEIQESRTQFKKAFTIPPGEEVLKPVSLLYDPDLSTWSIHIEPGVYGPDHPSRAGRLIEEAAGREVFKVFEIYLQGLLGEHWDTFKIQLSENPPQLKSGEKIWSFRKISEDIEKARAHVSDEARAFFSSTDGGKLIQEFTDSDLFEDFLMNLIQTLYEDWPGPGEPLAQFWEAIYRLSRPSTSPQEVQAALKVLRATRPFFDILNGRYREYDVAGKRFEKEPFLLTRLVPEPDQIAVLKMEDLAGFQSEVQKMKDSEHVFLFHLALDVIDPKRSAQGIAQANRVAVVLGYKGKSFLVYRSVTHSQLAQPDQAGHWTRIEAGLVKTSGVPYWFVKPLNESGASLHPVLARRIFESIQNGSVRLETSDPSGFDEWIISLGLAINPKGEFLKHNAGKLIKDGDGNFEVEEPRRQIFTKRYRVPWLFGIPQPVQDKSKGFIRIGPSMTLTVTLEKGYPELIINETGASYDFSDGNARTIGRGLESDDTHKNNIPVPVEQDTVSRKHAGVQWMDGKFLVRDLGSTNGTYVANHFSGEPGDWEKIKDWVPVPMHSRSEARSENKNDPWQELKAIGTEIRRLENLFEEGASKRQIIKRVQRLQKRLGRLKAQVPGAFNSKALQSNLNLYESRLVRLFFRVAKSYGQSHVPGVTQLARLGFSFGTVYIFWGLGPIFALLAGILGYLTMPYLDLFSGILRNFGWYWLPEEHRMLDGGKMPQFAKKLEELTGMENWLIGEEVAPAEKGRIVDSNASLILDLVSQMNHLLRMFPWKTTKPRGLVIGTGSGIEAMAILHQFLDKQKPASLQLDMIDLHQTALDNTRENLERQIAHRKWNFQFDAGENIFRGPDDSVLRLFRVSEGNEFSALRTSPPQPYDFVVFMAPNVVNASQVLEQHPVEEKRKIEMPDFVFLDLLEKTLANLSENGITLFSTSGNIMALEKFRSWTARAVKKGWWIEYFPAPNSPERIMIKIAKAHTFPNSMPNSGRSEARSFGDMNRRDFMGTSSSVVSTGIRGVPHLAPADFGKVMQVSRILKYMAGTGFQQQLSAGISFSSLAESSAAARKIITALKVQDPQNPLIAEFENSKLRQQSARQEAVMPEKPVEALPQSEPRESTVAFLAGRLAAMAEKGPVELFIKTSLKGKIDAVYWKREYRENPADETSSLKHQMGFLPYDKLPAFKKESGVAKLKPGIRYHAVIPKAALDHQIQAMLAGWAYRHLDSEGKGVFKINYPFPIPLLAPDSKQSKALALRSRSEARVTFDLDQTMEYLIKIFHDEPKRRELPSLRELAKVLGPTQVTFSNHYEAILETLEAKLQETGFDRELKKRIQQAMEKMKKKRAERGEHVAFDLTVTVNRIVKLFQQEPERKELPKQNELVVALGWTQQTFSNHYEDILETLETKVTEKDFDSGLKRRIQRAIGLSRNLSNTAADYVIELFQQEPERKKLPSQSELATILGPAHSTFSKYYEAILDTLEAKLQETGFDRKLKTRIRQAMQETKQKQAERAENVAFDLIATVNHIVKLFRKEPERKELPGWTALAAVLGPTQQTFSRHYKAILETLEAKLQETGFDQELKKRIQQAIKRSKQKQAERAESVAFDLTVTVNHIVKLFQQESERKELPKLRELAEVLGPTQVTFSNHYEAILETLEAKLQETGFDRKLKERIQQAIQKKKQEQAERAEHAAFDLTVTVNHIVKLFRKEPKRKKLPSLRELAAVLGPTHPTFANHYNTILEALEAKLQETGFDRELKKRILLAISEKKQVRSEVRLMEEAAELFEKLRIRKEKLTPEEERLLSSLIYTVLTKTDLESFARMFIDDLASIHTQGKNDEMTAYAGKAQTATQDLMGAFLSHFGADLERGVVVAMHVSGEVNDGPYHKEALEKLLKFIESYIVNGTVSAEFQKIFQELEMKDKVRPERNLDRIKLSDIQAVLPVLMGKTRLGRVLKNAVLPVGIVSEEGYTEDDLTHFDAKFAILLEYLISISAALTLNANDIKTLERVPADGHLEAGSELKKQVDEIRARVVGWLEKFNSDLSQGVNFNGGQANVMMSQIRAFIETARSEARIKQSA